MPPSPDVVLQQEGEHFSSHVKKKKKEKRGLFISFIGTYLIVQDVGSRRLAQSKEQEEQNQNRFSLTKAPSKHKDLE